MRALLCRLVGHRPERSRYEVPGPVASFERCGRCGVRLDVDVRDGRYPGRR